MLRKCAVAAVLGILLAPLCAGSALARLPAGYQNSTDPQTFFTAGLLWKHNVDYRRAIQEFIRAIELDPGHVKPCNALAWLLATCPKSEYRDGELALRLAQRVVDIVGDGQYVYLDTLAATYAELGRFDEAMATQNRVVELARDQGQDITPYVKRLESYTQSQPWRER